jgi:hypothetical protein
MLSKANERHRVIPTLPQIINVVAHLALHALAALFLFTIFFAQTQCSIFPSFGTQCHGPEGDIWMLPFFFAPFGIPLTIVSIIFITRQVMRRVRAP